MIEMLETTILVSAVIGSTAPRENAVNAESLEKGLASERIDH